MGKSIFQNTPTEKMSHCSARFVWSSIVVFEILYECQYSKRAKSIWVLILVTNYEWSEYYGLNTCNADGGSVCLSQGWCKVPPGIVSIYQTNILNWSSMLRLYYKTKLRNYMKTIKNYKTIYLVDLRFCQVMQNCWSNDILRLKTAWENSLSDFYKPSIVWVSLADPGEARGCSTNTFIID